MYESSVRYGNIGKSPIEVGRFTYGFDRLEILEWGEGAKLKIGSFCSIAGGIKIILGGNHRLDWITTFPFGHIYHEELGCYENNGHPTTNGDIVIGNDVWIGEGATIMSGVSIGDGAVIASNATVVRNINPYEVHGGNPAKFIKKRFADDVIEILLELKWWNLSIEEIKKIIPILCAHPSYTTLIELLKINIKE